MRQVGVLAAAGLVALEKMIARLEEDHANAQVLARGLTEIRGVKIDAERVQTNILVLTSRPGQTTNRFPRSLSTRCLANGINRVI